MAGTAPSTIWTEHLQFETAFLRNLNQHLFIGRHQLYDPESRTRGNFGPKNTGRPPLFFFFFTYFCQWDWWAPCSRYGFVEVGRVGGAEGRHDVEAVAVDGVDCGGYWSLHRTCTYWSLRRCSCMLRRCAGGGGGCGGGNGLNGSLHRTQAGVGDGDHVRNACCRPGSGAGAIAAKQPCRRAVWDI